MGSLEEDNGRQTKKLWWNGTAALPLTYEELLKRANCWTLGADAATATLLQEISSKLIAGTHEVVSRLQEACDACDRAGVHVTNLTSSFLLLSDAQFVENRTYSEGASDKISPEQNNSVLPLDQGATHLHEADAGLFSCHQAIRNGLDLVDRVHEQVQIADSDSESDLDQVALDGSHDNNPLMILRHVDPYATRKLPHVIGSKLFLEDIWVGLGAPDGPMQRESTPSPPHDTSEDNSSPILESLLQEVKPPCVRSPFHVPPISAEGTNVSNEPARASLFESSSSSDAEGIFPAAPVPDTTTLKRGSKVQSSPNSPSTETRVFEEPRLQQGPAEPGGAPPLLASDSSDDGDELFVPIRKPHLLARGEGAAPRSSGLPPSIGAPPSRGNIFDSSSDDETVLFAPRVTDEHSHPQLQTPKSPIPPLEKKPHRPPLEPSPSDVIPPTPGPRLLPASVEGFPPAPFVPSIFSDDEDDDIFASLPPKNSSVKERGRESLFSQEEGIFADIITLPKASNSTGGDFSSPPSQANPRIFSDDEDDDDDLFSIGPPKPKDPVISVPETGITESGDSHKNVPQSSSIGESPCRRPVGGVALFGGPELLSKLKERRSEGGSRGSSPEEPHIVPSGTSGEEHPQHKLTPAVIPSGPNTLLKPVPISPTHVSVGQETSIAFDRESRSTPLLVSINKTRPRLQHRRKPPSKKSRRGPSFGDSPTQENLAEHAPSPLPCSPAKALSSPPVPSDISSGVQNQTQPCGSLEKQKKAPVSCVSIFGDDDADDDLFSSVLSKTDLPPKEISLFSDDDDTMFTGPVSASAGRATASKDEFSLFDDDDDLFSWQPPRPQTIKPLNPVESGDSSVSVPRESEQPSSGSQLVPIEESDDPLSKFLS